MTVGRIGIFIRIKTRFTEYPILKKTGIKIPYFLIWAGNNSAHSLVKKRKYYKVQSEPILGKWQHCQNPQMPIFLHLF